MSAPAHTAFCPVKGCGRMLEVDSSTAHLPLTCPCERRARLSVGLSGVGGWVLRERPYTQGEREEHNLIMHALITGQVHDSGLRPSQRTDRVPDPHAASMTVAFQAWREAASLTIRHVLTASVTSGPTCALAHRQALESAQQAQAAERSLTLAQRSYNRNRRTHHSGRWRDGEEYWIERLDANAENEVAPTRFVFPFIAVWGMDGASLELANAQEIEALSGAPVGEEGWRSLMKLLQRLDDPGKPGQLPDPEQPIWREQDGRLGLRPYIRTHYHLAVHALEAIRRTLRPVPTDPPRNIG